jgi:hypothetical protein
LRLIRNNGEGEQPEGLPVGRGGIGETSFGFDRSSPLNPPLEHAMNAFRSHLLATAPTRIIMCAFIVSSCISATSVADTISVHYPSPFLDRWNYPFNASPGVRPNASIFAPYVGEELHEDFDNRDAQFHIAFDTSADIEIGLGPERYHVTEAAITVQVSNNNNFRYDPTYDPWQTYLPSYDPDYFPDDTPGRPIELYGVGFRNGFGPLTYQENTPYSPHGGFGKFIRTTYALDYDDDGQPRDVSNNIDERYDTFPFAIGTAPLTPGSFVPSATIITFHLDLDDPFVQQYLAEQLDLGRLHFMLASLHHATEDQDGSFPEFYCKENQLVIAGFREAAKLWLTVEILDPQPDIPGDLNGDGVVNVADLLILFDYWGTCNDPDECPADLNGDGVVNVADLLILFDNWG